MPEKVLIGDETGSQYYDYPISWYNKRIADEKLRLLKEALTNDPS